MLRKNYSTGQVAEVGWPDPQKAILANAFSLAMLPEGKEFELQIERVSLDRARSFLLYSIVGHQSTAEYFSQLLGKEVSCNRENFTLQPDQRLLVGQVQGRLPEGKVLTLAEMPPVVWYLCQLVETEAQKGKWLQAAQIAAQKLEQSWENAPEE